MAAKTEQEAADMVALSRHLADEHGVWFTRRELQRETLVSLTERHSRYDATRAATWTATPSTP